MSEQRFILHESTGYRIHENSMAPSRWLYTSLYVMDALNLYHVVGAFGYTHKPGKRDRRTVIAAAHAECDRLNEWWKKELASG